jgi:isopentenyl-diphosphate delta-isomerase
MPEQIRKPRIAVVDEDDRFVAFKDRDELAVGDMYRVTSLWLKNSRGEVLLAQRALSKKKDPGKWSCAVAGTVDEGEDYDANIIKEIQEEIGITMLLEDLVRGPKMLVHGGTNDFFDQWYIGSVPADTALVRQEEEVADLRWMNPQEVLKILDTNPDFFVASAKEWLPQLLKV